MLTNTFLNLVTGYSKDTALANDLWLEIVNAYSGPKRHYHTLGHLESLFTDLKVALNYIDDWETMVFAVCYHDIVYKATSGTNELDSAKLASKRLTEIGYPSDKIKKCTAMILATKHHEKSGDSDTDLFTDADLGILGQAPVDYQQYTENIRKEYAIYPDFLYNPGRRKVVQHFLGMEKIFKKDYFFNKYEKQARINLATELENLL